MTDLKIHRYNTRSKLSKKKTKYVENDYDNVNDSDSEWVPEKSGDELSESDEYDEYDDDNSDEFIEFDVGKYRNMLSQLFPSNYSKNKVKDNDNVNIILSINPNEFSGDEDDNDCDDNDDTKLSKFNKLLKLDKSSNNNDDFNYFKYKLDEYKQNFVIDELSDINNYYNNYTTPYKIQLLETPFIPKDIKAIAYRKINMFQNMDPNTGEYYKLKNWVDGFMRIPFGKYSSLPVILNRDGIDSCSKFMNNSINILHEAVYGMNDVKMQIMQMLGQWISNPSAIGTSLAIKGPMGTGKTTLVKNGISKILGREFAFISLGGATDSSYLEGHSYTYEGSLWGKIIDILIQTKTMNPIIYFDELDKISDTPKGEEIIGILTHLTDTSQNSNFHDKYFSDLHFDLSKAIFIFSYNHEEKINPILKDRMFCVETIGYNTPEKTIISNDYLIPTIINQVNIKNSDIIFNNDNIKYIIENYTNKEQGVRNLKRCLELIYTKCNLYRFIKPDNELFKNEITNITFPINVDTKLIDSILKKRGEKRNWQTMYM